MLKERQAMGLELLGVRERVRQAFGVSLGERYFDEIAGDRRPFDFTASELFDYLCRTCQTADRPVPADAWLRFRTILSESAGVAPREVTPATRLFQDLGCG